ncbi:MAG: hypothetical protein GXP62_05925 [Oligoflexia bacterium]|nr:hypothetical protein [Oligoflexia bacterium]
MPETLMNYFYLLVLFLGIACLWSFQNLVSGWLCGWAGLGKRWRTNEAPSPRRIRGMRCALGRCKSTGFVSMAATPQGLDMRMVAINRVGHPPLCIPWKEIEDLGSFGSLRGPQEHLRLGEDGPTLRLSKQSWGVLQAQREALGEALEETPGDALA